MRRYNQITISVLAAGMAVGLSIPANAQELFKPSGGCNATTYNVHAIIADKDSNTNPFQIQSDGQGAYPNGSSDATVDQVGQFSCQWFLDTTSSSRTIGLTFALPSTSGATPPFQQAQVHAKVFSRCPNGSGGDIDWTTMTLNVANQCGSTIQFSYNANGYTLKMNPSSNAGSTWIQVTCGGVNSSNNQCNMWSVTPIPNAVINPAGQISAIGELVETLRNGKSQSLGLYYLAFSYTITNP